MEFTYDKSIKVDFRGTTIEFRTDKQNNSVAMYVDDKNIFNLSASDFSKSFLKLVNQFDREVVQKEMMDITLKHTESSVSAPYLIAHSYDKVLFNQLMEMVSAASGRNVKVYGDKKALRHALPTFFPHDFLKTDYVTAQTIDGVVCVEIDVSKTKRKNLDNVLLLVPVGSEDIVDMYFNDGSSDSGYYPIWGAYVVQ